MACKEEKSQYVYFVSAEEVVLKQPSPAALAEYHRLQNLENLTQDSSMKGTNQGLFSTLESECEAASESTDLINAAANITPTCYCDIGLALCNGISFTCEVCEPPIFAGLHKNNPETVSNHLTFQGKELEVPEALVIDFERLTAQLPHMLS